MLSQVSAGSQLLFSIVRIVISFFARIHKIVGSQIYGRIYGVNRLIGNFCSFGEKGAHIINVSSWKGPVILLIISQGSQVSRWQTNKDNWQWNLRNPADKITQRKRQLWKAWEDEQCFKLSTWNWKLSQMLHLHITAIIVTIIIYLSYHECYKYILK